jgi:addiction module HigA family antidote
MSIIRSDFDNIDLSDVADTSVPQLDPIHPGEILREDWLEPMGITPYRAAKEMGVPPNRLTAILAGDRAITADTAVRLGLYFGTDPQSWLNLQAHYDLEVTLRKHGAEIAQAVTPHAA